MIRQSRTLVFDRLDQVMVEVDLLRSGCETSGGWTFGQILYHLAVSLQLSMTPGVGPSVASLEPNEARMMDVRRRRFFRGSRFPEGASLPFALQNPPAEADATFEALRLRDWISRIEGFPGPFPLHPLLGPLSKMEWTTFHCMHCAHHLGFAQPITSEPN